MKDGVLIKWNFEFYPTINEFYEFEHTVTYNGIRILERSFVDL